MKKVVVHVLGYRAINHLQAGSLRAMLTEMHQMRDCETHLVFQDNYSQDGSIEYALGMEGLDVILSPQNLLYTEGVNRGLQYIEYAYKPDYVILADADNYCSAGCYERLVRFMEDNPLVGMAQPLVVSKQDPTQIYSCGHEYVNNLFCRPIRKIPDDLGFLRCLQSCSLCSTIVRVDVLRSIGILNECFKIYYESSDLSFRIRAAGYSCACCMEAIAYNEGTNGSKTGNYHEAFYRWRNGLLLWYMHDAEKYLAMREVMLRELSPLQRRFNESKYCTDCVEESARKGIVEGMRICDQRSPEELRACVPSIVCFDKSSVIVLQKG